MPPVLFNDCCSKILPSLRGVDLILADPPYGVTKNQWDTPIENIWNLLDGFMCPIILSATNPYAAILITENIKNFRYEWVWEKSKASGFLNAKIRPLPAHELILVFSKDTPPYYPVMAEGKPYNKGIRKDQSDTDSYGEYQRTEVKSDGTRYPRSVQYFKTAEREGSYHKTQKPIAMMEYLIQTYTKPGATVLDFCMGSGTTGVAANNTGRNFIGIEKNQEIFNIAQERLS